MIFFLNAERKYLYTQLNDMQGCYNESSYMNVRFVDIHVNLRCKDRLNERTSLVQNRLDKCTVVVQTSVEMKFPLVVETHIKNLISISFVCSVSLYFKTTKIFCTNLC